MPVDWSRAAEQMQTIRVGTAGRSRARAAFANATRHGLLVIVQPQNFNTFQSRFSEPGGTSGARHRRITTYKLHGPTFQARAYGHYRARRYIPYTSIVRRYGGFQVDCFGVLGGDWLLDSYYSPTTVWALVESGCEDPPCMGSDNVKASH